MADKEEKAVPIDVARAKATCLAKIQAHLLAGKESNIGVGSPEDYWTLLNEYRSYL